MAEEKNEGIGLMGSTGLFWIFAGCLYLFITSMLIFGDWCFNWYHHLLWYPHDRIKELKKSLNPVGGVLLEILSNIVLAIPTIFVMVCMGIALIPIFIWEGFKYLFRKRDKGE